MNDEIAQAAIRSTPPTAVVGWAYIAGMPLETWVAIATLIYILLQTFFLLKDRYAARKSRRKFEDAYLAHEEKCKGEETNHE